MVKDPVCGMPVNEKDARKSEYGGKSFYFCSESCQERFDQDPGNTWALRRRSSPRNPPPNGS